MKDWLIPILLLAVVIVGGMFTINYLQKTSTEIIRSLDNVENAVMEENWHKARLGVNNLKKKWQANKPFWELLVEHTEIDNIDVSLVHINSYLMVEKKGEVLAEISGLRLFLKHIPENELLNLENIF